MNLVCVAVEQAAYSFDKLFDYLVPPQLCHSAKPGCRVCVPFGRGNSLRTGLILAQSEAPEEKNADSLKMLTDVLDEQPVLNEEALQLVQWLKERYFCTYWEALRLLLPAGMGYHLDVLCTLGQEPDFPVNEEQERLLALLRQKSREETELLQAAWVSAQSTAYRTLLKKGCILQESTVKRTMQDTTRKMVRLNGEAPEQLSPKQRQVVGFLQNGPAYVKDVLYFTGVTKSVVDGLVRKKLAVYYEEAAFKIPKTVLAAEKKVPAVLSEEQRQAYTALLSDMNAHTLRTALLYGVTGSGKTQIYLHLMEDCLRQGRGVIVMVPEISLTPQTLQIFQSYFGDEIAVFHSALSMGERMDAWKRVQSGRAKIAIGTRSAVFAPFADIGLIILDEEQEYSYKSEMAPRFHTREVAKFRCAYHGALCLLASATPRVESYYYANLPEENKNHIRLCTLTHRYGKALLPQVDIVDMNIERAAGNPGAFSAPLLQALEDNLQKKEQSILLLNRRGYHTHAVCGDCKQVLTCPNCSISLTYHSANNRLLCHYCGFSMPFTTHCPACGGEKVRYTGMGTQRAEDELTLALPQARILRMDTDAVSGRLSLEEKLDAFAKGEYDIIVGTQMVAKGLDFPKVTLVGVLNADQALYADDFRANERAFALLTQVVGRSGRGDFPGRAIIQTFTPENPVIPLSCAQDYPAFFARELPFRKAMLYPPFSDLYVIGFTSEDRSLTEKACTTFFTLLRTAAEQEFPSLPLRVLSPSAAGVVKLHTRYRYKIVIKCRNTGALRTMLRTVLKRFAQEKAYAEVTVFTDCNPDVIP